MSKRDKIYLLGEAPNEKTDGHPKLWLRPDSSGIAHTANLLLARSGLRREQYLEMFERDCLLHYYPGRDGRGAKFPLIAAREVSVDAIRKAERHPSAVVLGRRLSRAFSWMDGVSGKSVPLEHLQFFRWYLAAPHGVDVWSRSVPAAIVPHPSGVNRWWNDPKNQRRAKRFFTSLRKDWENA